MRPTPTELKILEYTEDNYKMGTLARFCGEECPNEEAFRIGKAMAVLMTEKKGLGLACNQIGLFFPLIVVLIKNKPVILYKPKVITIGKEEEVAKEGCLSLPEVFREIKRPTMVKFSAIVNKSGKRKEFTLRGLEARAFFHEIDHLQGITILCDKKG